MKQTWRPAELEEHWTLSKEEAQLASSVSTGRRFAFALQLKHLELEGHFPSAESDFPRIVVAHVAGQLGVDHPFELDRSGRTGKRHRVAIREHLGYRAFSGSDHRSLHRWLIEDAIDSEPRRDRLIERAMDRCRQLTTEPPGRWRLDRIIGSALRAHQNQLFTSIDGCLTPEARSALDRLLEDGDTDESDGVSMNELKADPGRMSLKTAEAEVAKLRAIEAFELPAVAFEVISPRVLERHRARIESEPPSQTRRHKDNVRYPLVAIYC